MKQIPVTILTGFLGSGKTTLLNKILSTNHGKKLAVIVNEIGKVGIDNQLIVNTNEEIMEMTNGCICCTVREDLLIALKKLLTSKQGGKVDFEGIIIETTGLANPGPIIGTFFLDPTVQEAYVIDGVVTVVDGFHIQKHFEKGQEAEEQIAFADVVLLNKMDLVEDVDSIQRSIQSINPTANIISCENCDVNIEELLTIKTFVTKEKLDIYTYEGCTNHLKGVCSFVIRIEEPLDMGKVNGLMSAIVSELGENLYRYKGILNIASIDERVVFQGVHTLFAGKMDRTWREGEERVSELVFIGSGLNKEWFEKNVRDCILKP